MYNVYVKRIFVITEIVRMNAGVSSEKEKVKESQSVTKGGTPARHPLRVPGRGRHTSTYFNRVFRKSNICMHFLNFEQNSGSVSQSKLIPYFSACATLS